MIVKPKSTRESTETLKPWWNRPLIGNKSMLERTRALFFRQPVGEEAIMFHENTFQDMSTLTRRIVTLRDEKFGSKEFLAFVRISRSFNKGQGKYANLKEPMELLRAGLTAHNSFTNLEQIEFTHRGRKFNEFYRFVDALCLERAKADVFQQKVKTKSLEMASIIKSLEGKEALRRYVLHLNNIGSHQLSLNLLYAFKRLHFRSYNIFCVISDVLKRLKRSDLMKKEAIMTQVIQELESFDKLGDLIGLKKEQQTVQVYCLLFQYLAMSEKHNRSYEQFTGLVSQLRQWESLYQQLIKVRQQFPKTEYKVPKPFSSKVPGVEIYDRYSQYFE